MPVIPQVLSGDVFSVDACGVFFISDRIPDVSAFTLSVRDVMRCRCIMRLLF